MKSTDAFELSPSSEEYRQSIISKIEDDLETVKNQLDSQISNNEFRKLIGKRDALERLKVRINAIQEDSVRLVDPNSRILATPQYLSTDNKFLNAAYWQAMVIRKTQRGFDGSVASSPEGESGKREAMSEIMAYIKHL